MFIWIKEELHLTEAASNIPAIKAILEVKSKEEKREMLYYLYFVHTKRGKLKDNPYKSIPFTERCTEVQQQQKLKKSYNDYIENPKFQAAVTAYNNTQTTLLEQEREFNQERLSGWQQKLKELGYDDPKKDNEIQNCIRSLRAVIAELDKLIQMEDISDDILENTGGVPLYLYETPENYKPQHLKI